MAGSEGFLGLKVVKNYPIYFLATTRVGVGLPGLDVHQVAD